MTTAEATTHRQYSAEKATRTLDEEKLNPLKHVNLVNFISLSPVLIDSRTFMFEYIYTKSFIQNHFSYHIIDWIMFKFQFAIAKKTKKTFYKNSFIQNH